MAPHSTQDELRDPRSLFRWLRRVLFLLGAIYIALLGVVLFTISPRVRPELAEFSYFNQFALIVGSLQLINLMLFLCSLVLGARLTYRTMKNVHILKGAEERITPFWSVAWYLVPIANLVMPPKAVWQIWVGTFGDGPMSIRRAYTIWAWWLTTVVGIVCGQASLYLLMRDGVTGFSFRDLLSPAQYLLAALGAYFFVRTFDYISRAQTLLLQRAAVDLFN